MKLLVLGDSYTIGEGVHPASRWPSVLAGLLKRQGRAIDRITYVARTGWTTGNLLNALNSPLPYSNYNAVLLLIGVNNQYQGLSIDNYATDFEQLVQKAISYASGNPSNVFVISLPDWGVSPFAADKDQQLIAQQIDQFNKVNARIADANHCVYVDITELSRTQTAAPYFAADHLHPSPHAYKEWANKFVSHVRRVLE